MRSTSFARVFVSAAGLFLGLAAPGASAALVLEYKFDEGSGGTAVDSSPSGNNGNVSGGGGASYTTTAAQGPFAIHLGATGNGLSWVQPAANPLAGVTSFTIAAWVDPSAAGESRSIFSNTPGSGTGPGFNLYLNSPGTSDLALVLATNGALLKTPSLGSFGVYHFVAVTVSSAGSNPVAALYVDGVQQATTGTVANITDLSTLPRIGVFTDGNFNSNFFGNLDDVRVFDTALTPAQVAALMPEPGTAGLLAVAAGAACFRSRRRRDRARGG